LVKGRNRRVKILGEGSLSKALTVRAHGFSAKAKEKIEAVGGKAELISLHA
jgi:large subunit ribosomal protein L15